MAKQPWSTSPILRTVLLVLLLGASVVAAATTLKIAVDPGTTVVTIDGTDVRIDATASVIVVLSSDSTGISGTVEPAPGVRSSDVTITVLGSPDVVIFRGRVSAPVEFEDYIFTEETGRGEQ